MHPTALSNGARIQTPTAVQVLEQHTISNARDDFVGFVIINNIAIIITNAFGHSMATASPISAMSTPINCARVALSGKWRIMAFGRRPQRNLGSVAFF